MSALADRLRQSAQVQGLAAPPDEDDDRTDDAGAGGGSDPVDAEDRTAGDVPPDATTDAGTARPDPEDAGAPTGGGEDPPGGDDSGPDRAADIDLTVVAHDPVDPDDPAPSRPAGPRRLVSGSPELDDVEAWRDVDAALAERFPNQDHWRKIPMRCSKRIMQGMARAVKRRKLAARKADGLRFASTKANLRKILSVQLLQELPLDDVDALARLLRDHYSAGWMTDTQYHTTLELPEPTIDLLDQLVARLAEVDGLEQIGKRHLCLAMILQGVDLDADVVDPASAQAKLDALLGV